MTFMAPPAMVDTTAHEALAIAMAYLESTGQSYPYSEVRCRCANIIQDEWNAGRRHRIWLANKAIVELEKTRQAGGTQVPIRLLHPTGSS